MLVLAGLYFGRDILIPLALAVLLALLFSPLTARLRRWGLLHLLSVIALLAQIGDFFAFVARAAIRRCWVFAARCIPASGQDKVNELKPSATVGGRWFPALEVWKAPPTGHGCLPPVGQRKAATIAPANRTRQSALRGIGTKSREEELDAHESAARSRSSLTYRADIDGLRAVAVLSVVGFHAFPDRIPGGFIGVDVFFVISGFLISTLILSHLQQGSFRFSDFFARRIRRLFPALLVVLLASLALGWWMLFSDEYAQLGKHVAAGAGFVSNLVLWAEAGYFDASALTKPLLHLWSLGIEEQFYLIWPVVLWLSWHYAPRWLPALTLLLALVSFHWSDVQGDLAAAFYNPLTRFWELWAGSALAWLSHQRRAQPALQAPRRRPWLEKGGANVASASGCALLAWGLWHINEQMPFPGLWALVPVSAALLIIAAGPDAWINRVVLSNQLAVWFGLISFALYLWHWPVLTLARIASFDPLSKGALVGLVLLSVLLAWLTYRFIERPIRYSTRPGLRTPMLAGLMTLTLVAGYLTYTQAGWPQRPISQHKALVHPDAIEREMRMHKAFRNYSGSEPETSSKPVILIIGDSYVTAWSAALSAHIDQDRYDILSLSYLGCTVVAQAQGFRVSAMANAQNESCGALDHYLHAQTVARRIVAVMMVGHRPFEYAANPFRFDLVQWLHAGNADTDIYVFGNYFQLDSKVHPSCQKLMQRARRDASVCLERAVFPRTDTDLFNRSLPYFPVDLDFHFVDLIELHCSYDRVGCLTEVDGVPFMFDWNHVSAVFLQGLLGDILEKRKTELLRLGLLKYLKHPEN